MTGEVMIECEGLTKRFGHFTAVDHVSFKIEKGSIFGFLGRNAMLRLSARTGLRDLPVEVRPQILYNPEMRSPNFLVPGVIGLVLQIATMFASAMALVSPVSTQAETVKSPNAKLSSAIARR